MARPSASYEVQIYKSDHWVLDLRFDAEAEALARARRILSGGKVDGVRVVRDWRRTGGRHIETEIHAEFRPVSRTVTIVPIDEPPPLCQTVQDCYGVQSRMVMNRMLRNYVERAVVTPTELLHNHAELARLQNTDNLMPTAVGRVAALQAEKAGGDGRSRRDALNALLHDVAERARFDALDAGTEPEERDFLARVVLSRELVQMRNWLAKLDFLGELVREDGGLADAPLALLDGVIADVLGAPSVVQELLGIQGSLAEALCNLIDLSRGRMAAGDRTEDDRAVHLNELLAFHDLDETRLVILDLVRRQLKGTQPLYRFDPEQEKTAFLEVLRRAVTPNGVTGDGPMAEALVLRSLRFLEGGGTKGRRRAIDDVVAGIPEAEDKLRFLVALADSDLGLQYARDIGAALDRLTRNPADFARFIDRRQPVRANLEALTALYERVTEAPLPEDTRGRLADNLDHMLVAYIISSRVVEQYDSPDDSLRRRANRLMQLCLPGTLRSRRALDMVRQRVVAHLRQPNFDQKYVEDLPDPDQQQRALREFHRLLEEAGLT